MPDLGSFLDDRGTYKKTMYGLEADIPKLQDFSTSKPTYFSTGDVAYCVDTGVIYIYERTTATWYKQ